MVSLLEKMVQENRLTGDDLPRVEAKLFFEGASYRRSLERFGILLTLSTIIATYAVLVDSTATVIGAMIIAPLMTPIMATAAALVMGHPRRATQSLLLVVVGVGWVIGLAWLLAMLFPGIIAVQANSQITARIAPTLPDLFIALASGAAGAFAMSREDIADSLPGVAIAIALVPPLAVVGITLSEGDFTAASGALLLFLTNLLSILLMGGAVFSLLGLGRASTSEMTGKARQQAFATIGIGVLLVAIPLGYSSYQLFAAAVDQTQASGIAEAWADEVGFQVRTLQVRYDTIYVLVSGDGDPPNPEALQAELAATLRQPVLLDLEVVQSQRQYIPEVPATSPAGDNRVSRAQ